MSGTPNAWERYFPTFRRTNERLERWMGRLPLRGRGLPFAAGAVIGGGGLSSVALWIDRRDASAILASASLGDDDDDDDSGTVCCGAVERWVAWPYPHWQASDAELNRRLLLLRPRKSGAAKATSSVVLAEGGERCTAVPLKGATVTPAGGSGKPLSLSIKTAAGHHETLRNFSVGDSAQQWQLSLEAAAGPAKAANQAAKLSAPKRVMAVTYPDHWEAPFDRYRTVRLAKTSAEYKRVEALALKQQKRKASGWVRGRISVTGIERVQSPQVWEQYCMRRAIVASGNGGDANEMMLWHGTPSRSCGVIGRQGFDPRVCSLQGMFGGGVYFADKTTKSARYSGCSRPGDHGRMFLCRVSLGRQLRKVLPSSGLRRVPDPFPLFPSQLSPWLFGEKAHSIFAPAKTPPSNLLMNEFIVFHSNQGYPEYLIDFTLK